MKKVFSRSLIMSCHFGINVDTRFGEGVLSNDFTLETPKDSPKLPDLFGIVYSYLLNGKCEIH